MANQSNRNDKKKSFWEFSYDGRIALSSIILFIVAPIMLTIYIYEKVQDYDNRCMEKSLFKISVDLQISNEKPFRLVEHEEYYELHFSENRILFSCDWESSENENGKRYKIDPNILNKRITKNSGDTIFYIEVNNVKEKCFFFIEWTN